MRVGILDRSEHDSRALLTGTSCAAPESPVPRPRCYNFCLRSYGDWKDTHDERGTEAGR